MDYPYQYTIDPPSSDPAYNKRMGFRTPRSILLPPYLMSNQFWIDYCDALDSVMGPQLDKKTDILSNLRNMWVTNPGTEELIQEHEILNFGDWSQPEREILVKQVNMLGLKLSNAGVVPNDGYHAISRFLGQYWFEKGTDAFIRFINFCLNSKLAIATMWTEDYVHFVEVENDDPLSTPGIGTPIWEGGTWYPTTHVTLVAKGGLETLDIPTLVSFFYEIANYNLVLWAVDVRYDMWIEDDVAATEPFAADIVAMGMWQDNNIVISNVQRFG